MKINPPAARNIHIYIYSLHFIAFEIPYPLLVRPRLPVLPPASQEDRAGPNQSITRLKVRLRGEKTVHYTLG